MEGKKLKIAIFSDSFFAEEWQNSAIKAIQGSEFAEIGLIILYSHSQGKLKHGMANEKFSLILSLHLKLDNFLFGRKLTFSRRSDLRNNTGSIQEVTYQEGVEGNNENQNKDSIIAIGNYCPDVILNMGNIQPDYILSGIPRYGLWSYRFSDTLVNRGGPHSYWEVCQNWGVIGSVIEMMDGHVKKTIYKSWSHVKSPSFALTRNSNCWKSSLFIPRILRNLYLFGQPFLDQQVRKFNKEVDIFDRPLYNPPGNIQATINIFYYFWHIFRYLYLSRLRYYYSWMLLINSTSGKYPLKPINEYTRLIPPKGSFWADPFVLTRDGKHYIFIEELKYKTWKGHISVIVVDNQNKPVEIRKVLERPYHLSYPGIFEHNGEIFMVPETSRNRTIELYKCTEFPSKWEFVMNLMENVYANDTTLIFYQDKWWMFTSIDETDGKVNSSDELFLFCSKDLLSSKWEKHSANPVISDSRVARPAGKLFFMDGNLYRPSQNNEGIYGRAININKVKSLGSEIYEEEIVTLIAPYWDKKIKGTHTLNFTEELTVIDGFYYQSRLKWPKYMHLSRYD
jgi:hypothetical protein